MKSPYELALESLTDSKCAECYGCGHIETHDGLVSGVCHCLQCQGTGFYLPTNQRAVYGFLKGHKRTWVGPKIVGQKVGGPGRGSAWASPILLELVRKGLVVRNDDAKYQIKEIKKCSVIIV